VVSSGYIDVREGPKESLAEMHIIELLQGLARNVQETLRELREIVEQYCEGNLDIVKNRHGKVRKFKEASEEAKSKVVEYIVRVSPTMVSKEMYANIAYSLEKVAQRAAGAAHRLGILASKGVKPKSEVAKGLTILTGKLFEEYEALRSALMMLSLNIKKVVEHCEVVLKLEEDIDDIYRNLGYSMFEAEDVGDLVKIILLKDLVDVLEESSDTIRESAENLIFIALHKLS